MQQKSQSNNGFSIIELMIVVVISGILMAIAVPSYTSYILNSHRQEVEQIMLRDQQYLEHYYHDNGSYLDSNGNYPVLPYSQSPESGDPRYSIAFETTKITGDERATHYHLVATPLGAQASSATNLWVCIDNDGNIKENTDASCN